MPDTTPAQAVAAFYQALSPASLAQIEQLYAPQVRFKDPFNDVTGTAAVRAIFEHMFRQLHQPRFVVTACIEQGGEAFLSWRFEFRFRDHAPTVQQTILGATHLQFDADGRVVLHRDYWDAAEELYEKLPWVGALMRWLKRRVNA
jgi:steroid Delta-isomerase